MLEKLGLISQFFTSKSDKQTITVRILPNISRSKNNDTIKVGQLREYDMRDIFLEKSYKNVVLTLFSDPFLENQKCTCLWISKAKFYTNYIFIN